ncbi:MAG: glycoside hydrolase family 3 N-terminal domain-containing protein [Solirubrobacterales bacterium]
MGKGAKALLVVCAAGVVCAGVALASGGGDAPTAPKLSAAASTAAKMSTTELIGQRITTGYVGATPPKSVLRAVRAGRVGGVILFSNNMPTPGVAKKAITRLQAWAKAGGMPRLLVMIDQEGGIVQRLPQLPPTRSPASIGRSGDPARVARSQGLATGRSLKKYGFNVNLAPVVDVVKVKHSFLGNRAYSSSSRIVADAGCAFAGGNETGGVAATFKHYPGLGRAGADTDFNDVSIGATSAQIEAETRAYRQCPDTPSLVMVSSARYPKLGIHRPSSLVKKTYSMLAGTGFTGLTITDALETPQFGPGANTARSAIAAGADVLLWGQAWGVAMRARTRLLADVRAGRITRDQLEGDAARIIELKNSLN